MIQRAAPLAASPPSTPGAPFAVRARPGELLPICALNGLLTLATLGGFHGWARTRVRRYLWSRTLFAGEPFAYTGSGMALLLGYALTAVVLVPLLVLPGTLPLPGGPGLGMALVSSALATLAFAFAAGVATFCARRYLLEHTHWRGTRFSLGGRARDHGALVLLYSVLTVITGGLYLPLMRNRLAAHLIDNARFGRERFRYEGGEDVLLRRYLLAGVLMLLVTVAWAVLVGAMFPFAAHFLRGAALSGPPALLPVALATGATLLLLPALWVVWRWYRAGELRHFVAHTRLGGARFTLALPPGRLVWLDASNAAALLFSLGLAYPWTVVRRARVLAEALRLDGVLELDAIAGHAPDDPAAHTVTDRP